MSYYKKLILFFPWMIVLLWMMLIYHFSAQPAVHSDQLSRGVTAVIMDFVMRFIPGMDLSMDRFDHVVRKNAHFLIYLMLAIWVFHALLKSRIYGLKSVFLAMGICILYAISDEIHQAFVPGRGPQLKDVFIDSAGALVGIVVYKVISR
ncbi:VanZ family protein [Neobacillus soli]|uniref:VanZ family protein n=1 Tax=Neobacillus soli TaxID=220688 RepID=UPI00082423EA|nr:VanZ family protein [Neobacillus soli]